MNSRSFAVDLGRFFAFTLTLTFATFTLEAIPSELADPPEPAQSKESHRVTKKEIVKQISDRIGLTQLKTKDIVQQTFDAIVETLLEAGRIELRNFGVFEVKMRKARKARNPRTGERVDVEPKMVVTFKPGKEMEERIKKYGHVAGPETAAQTVVLGADDDEEGDGVE
jgi:nucleoid DNA-binding protein